MRLRRENVADCPADSAEYRQAVKCVIRCQIQALLQKLASETGEESFVISTNVTTGTYNLLGSFLGREYMEEREDIVQNVCRMFTSFCSDAQTQSAVLKIPDINSRDESPPRGGTLGVPGHHSAKKKSTLPRPKSTPRKRPLNSSPSSEVPVVKRKTDIHPSCDEPDIHSPTNGQTDCRPQVSGYESDSSLQAEMECTSKDVMDVGGVAGWIKKEPLEESKSLDDPDDISQLQDSIINRPRSLIPLANIFKKYGGSKIKSEKVDPSQEDQQETSILRSLCESQPVFPAPDFGDGHDSPDGSMTDEKLSISLPTKSADDVDGLNTTTENLVLSGYYDSDTYPTYRHRQKHPPYSRPQKSKKDKNAGGGTCNVSSVETPISPGNVDLHLRTFESGGRLVYACDVCKRELSHLTSYRRHMKLHTMERPHKCPVCDKGFIRKYHCIDHLNKHHKGVEFDPDSLNLTGHSVDMNKEAQDHATLSDSMSVSPGEYNYTLDQSIPEVSLTETNQSLSSIDQTASTMLSELAKSAQKAQFEPLAGKFDVLASHLKQKSTESAALDQLSDSAVGEMGKSDDVCIEIVQSEDGKSDTNTSEWGTDKSNESSPGSTGSGCPGMARKTEVSDGIKAIVAHLKMASKNKRMNITRTSDSVKVSLDDG